MYTLKNSGLNITKRWVKYGQTQRLCLEPAQRLGYCPEGCVKHLTQLLVENSMCSVQYLPSSELYLTQHF